MIHKYFVEGEQAFAYGVNNPYPEDSEPYESWEAGWHHAWYLRAKELGRI